MFGRRGVVNLLLDNIRDPKCRACPLWKSSQHVCIMGRGNVVAPIVLIGEAPGETEGETGKPFMGPAGRYLDEVLEGLGMTHMVYITNMAKCRPPGNRIPKPEEYNTCTQLFLEKEVTAIQPKCIVAMSKIAITYLMGGGKSPFRRFQLYPPETKKWWTTAVVLGWHPSYIRRCGFKKDLVAEFKSQFTIARDYVSGLTNGE